MGKIHNNKIEKQVQPSNSQVLPPVSREQINNAKNSATRTKEQIYDYVKEKSSAANSRFDIDGDGRVTEYDGKFIEAYINENKRGVDLKAFVSPYASANLTEIAVMEQKVLGLINDKTLDLTAKGYVSNSDASLAEENISKFARETRIDSLISTGKLDVDGDGKVSTKDMDLIDAYKHGANPKRLKSMASKSSLSGQQISDRIKTLYYNKEFDVNQNNINGGSLDMARIRKAVEEHEAQPQSILGEGPTQP